MILYDENCRFCFLLDGISYQTTHDVVYLFPKKLTFD